MGDILDIAYNKQKDVLLNTLLNNKNRELRGLKELKNRTILVLAVIGGILVVSFFVYLRIQKYKKRRKQKETQALQQKINDAFKEVVQLAENNSPSFLPRFEEVYPEFSQKLLGKHPGLTNTERIFCAMVFLNFSSKEIAQYTFIEHRSV